MQITPRSGSTVAAGARGGVEVPLGELFDLRAYADVLVATGSVSLQIDQKDVFTFSPVSADVGLAGFARF
jgi:hypothetical protein